MQNIRVEKIATNEVNDDVIKLWHDVFNDSEEYVKTFLSKCKNAFILSVRNEGHVVSMLLMVRCDFRGKIGEYIYAVSTDESCRRNGFATSLIEEAKHITNSYLCLIPIDEKLKVFYEKLGFCDKYEDQDVKNELKFFEKKEIADDLFDGSNLENPPLMFYNI